MGNTATINYGNGCLYTGSVTHGKRNGEGVYKCKNRSNYSGEWVNNDRHGQGVMTRKFKRGDVLWEESYEGMFQRDQKNGFGSLIMRSKNSVCHYKGLMVDGLPAKKIDLVCFNKGKP